MAKFTNEMKTGIVVIAAVVLLGIIVAMVGDSVKKDSRPTGSIQRRSEVHQTHRELNRNTVNNRLLIKREKVTNPDQVIPMEDDFRDF